VHAGLDWDWEMPVVVVAALSCAAALVTGMLTARQRVGPVTRGAVIVAALVLGAFAIAGARSHTEPAAVRYVEEALAMTTAVIIFVVALGARVPLDRDDRRRLAMVLT
jgi:hypothetical protein